MVCLVVYLLVLVVFLFFYLYPPLLLCIGYFVYLVLCVYYLDVLFLLMYVLFFFLCVCYFVCCFVLFIDLFCDFLRGIFDFCCLLRVIQYCFIWFVCSEFVLFMAFFTVVFGLCLFLCCEFAFVFCLPLLFCCLLCDYGFVFYWYFLDLFNLLINTFYLFVSGLFVNFCLFCFWFRFFCCCCFVLWLSLLFGFLFLWNQLWEFTLLFVTLSCGVFGSILFLIDLLHFTHVFLGIFLLFICFGRLFNFLCMDTRFVFLYVVCLYWHFVDCVWFFLLRFVYFDVLCVMYLCV
uniref:Cytochrome c oxidase subunit 3 n=1 Tax=Trypanosoma lewisi TaxID=5695 RepID=A0A7G4WFE6_TRYLE|nr:putative cytochrome oxidase subunit III [Trypanosoma lewisi]